MFTMTSYFIFLGWPEKYNNMASDNAEGDSVKKSGESESSDNREYIERVRKFLSPLETRWSYVESVLLWEKPIHSLCYFIAMTALFG